MRFPLRALVIATGVAPAILAGWWFVGVEWNKYPAGIVGFGILSLCILLALWTFFREP